MVDRSQPLVVTPQACPFVALDGDRDQRLTVPDPMHRCFAEPSPKARSMGHQANFCLTAAFAGCPIFLDWAQRVAADVVETGPGGLAAPAAATTSSASTTPAATPPFVPMPATGDSRSAMPAWVAEAVPPPPDSMEVPSRRTARVAVDAGVSAQAMAAPALPTAPPPTINPSSAPLPSLPTSPTTATAVVTAAYPPAESPALAPRSMPNTSAQPDPDGDTAAELAASMARTDLMIDGDSGSGGIPLAAAGADDDGTDAPPWSRGRPRVPVDAGAPTSLGPQTRPAPRPSGPREWEGARRFEAYAARTGSRRPGRPVLIAIGVGLVAVALLLVFMLPSLFGGGGAAPTKAPGSAAAGSPAATVRPRPTPTEVGATPERPQPTPGSYKVKRGDTLSSIGRKFNVSVLQLTCANNIRNSNLVTPGMTLVIPLDSYQCPRPTKKPKN